MATHHYWIPTNHINLHVQANNTWNYFVKHREEMGFEPDSPQGKWADEVFFPALCQYNEVYQEWEFSSSRTRAMTTALRTAEKDFKEAYKLLYIGHLKYNQLVSDSNLIGMALPPRKHHQEHSRHPMGGVYPVLTRLVLLPPCVIEFHYCDRDNHHRAKPHGVRGAEICWAVLDAPPREIAEMIHSSFSLRTPHRMTFDGDWRGKSVYFTFRWVGTRGEHGPWGIINRAIIP
jgi:hypothetical protein